MDNSFYYFFSATPQVLGGILALFGVFVIFKIQIISEVLHKKALDVFNETRTIYPPDFEKEKIKIGITIRRDIKEGIEQKDFKKIKIAIDLNEKEKIKQKSNFKRFAKEYYELYPKREKILSKTINYSIVTAAIIALCLSMLPLGKWLLCHKSLLIILFFLVVLGILYSFWKMILLLRQVLIE